MRRCIIHFGMHKTGSSSIQQSLFRQADRLSGVRYLHAGSANASGAIATAFGDRPHEYHANRKRGLTIEEVEERGRAVRARLSTELADSSATRFLLSAEDISLMSEAALARLIDWLGESVDEIEAVGYVRPPASFMASAFQQLVKSGLGQLRTPDLCPMYRTRFEVFDRVLGTERVQFWKFDPSSFPGGCVVRDFCARLQIALPKDGIVRVNESLSRQAVSLLYAYRKHGPGYGVGPTAIPENNRLIAALFELPGQPLRFSASAVRPVLEARRAQIAWMEQRMGVSLEERLTEDPDAITGEEDLLCFSPESIRWLAERSGSQCDAATLADPAPEWVACAMRELRLDLAREAARLKPGRKHPDAQGGGGRQTDGAEYLGHGDQSGQARQPALILKQAYEVDDRQHLTTEDLAARVTTNTGNLAFHHAIDLHLGGQVSSMPWATDPKRINMQEGCVVLPCANQLGSHTNLGSHAERLHGIDRPIVAIGLGAQSSCIDIIPKIPEGTLRWVREIVAHAPSAHPNIAVRGDSTRRVLAQQGLADHVVALGCPSLFISSARNLGQRIVRHRRTIRRIAVTAGNYKRTHLIDLERSLIRLVAEDAGYIVQSPLPMLKIARNEFSSLPPELLLKMKDSLCPEMNLEQFIVWARHHARCFSNIPDWIKHLRTFDFVIGTRIHGVMLALQAEVPALCIAHDSRTLELCEIMRIPHLKAADVMAGVSREDCERRFDFDPEVFDANRADLAERYVRFLRNNGLEPSEHLIRIQSSKRIQITKAMPTTSDQQTTAEQAPQESDVAQPAPLKPTLHLHIGNGKTGTSAIQKALAENADALRGRGLLYFGMCFENLKKRRFSWNFAGGSDHLFNLADAELANQTAACLEQAFVEARQLALEHVIWSNEWLFLRVARIAPAIARISDRFHLHVIVYLRRQDRWLLSAYKEWGIKQKNYSGPLLSFPEWYAKHFSRHELDYTAILDRWCQALPQARFSVRIYDRCPDVCEDFLTLLDVPYSELPVQVGRFYETPNDWLLSYSALFNNLLPDPVPPREIAPLLQSSGLSQLKTPAPIRFDLPDESFLRDLLERCQSGNERLAARFSTPEYSAAFDDSPPVASKPMQLAEPMALIAGLLRIVQYLDQDVRELRQQVVQLRRASDSQPARAVATDAPIDARHSRRIRLAIGIRADRPGSDTLAVTEATTLGEDLDVFWIADNRQEATDPGRFPTVVHRLEDDAAMGLPISGPRPLWYYGDYAFYRLQREAPGYDYYLLLASATWVRPDFFRRLLTELQKTTVDFVGCRFGPRPPAWHWWQNAHDHFESVYGSLFPLMLVSAKAVEHLLLVRLEQARQVSADQSGVFCESFVPSALMQAGFRCLDLNALIPDAWSAETFSPGKPIWSGELPHLLKSEWVIHPVLDGEDYVREARSWLQHNQDSADITLGLTHSLFGNPLPEFQSSAEPSP